MSLPAAYIADATSTYRTNYLGVVSFTILVWDHMITFADEVEYIWKGSKGPLVYLFFLNRYLTPLAFIVNLIAYLSPLFTPETCRQFVRFEGSMTVIGIEIVGLMMLLRVRAMHYANTLAVSFVGLILLIETGVNAWLLSSAQPVYHDDPYLYSCTMVFDLKLSGIASASAWLPLLYDTAVLVLTLHVRRQQKGDLIKKLFEGGLLYYSVICCVNLVLTIMIIAAKPGLKNITAQLELLLTVAMMSRITLDLKKFARSTTVHEYTMSTPSCHNPPSSRFARSRYRSRSFGSRGHSQLGTLTFTSRFGPPSLSPIISLQSLTPQGPEEAYVAMDDKSDVLGCVYDPVLEIGRIHARSPGTPEAQQICISPNADDYSTCGSPA